MTIIESYSHNDSKRKNLPTEQLQSLVSEKDLQAEPWIARKRNPALDPQLVWKGKYDGDEDMFTIRTKPIYIQEKINPQSIIANLKQHSADTDPLAPALFDDIFSTPTEVDKMAFYHHDQNWTNRMILGDSLQVMASLAEREGLRGKVQCIYIDPPYGIKFNSNFQWSTTTRDVKDGKADNMTREPEQVKAFRDTWREGIHSYLTYLRDRIVVAHDLLSDSGSIFVQINDVHVHRVRCLLDEVFGDQNFMSQIKYVTTSGFPSTHLSRSGDNILWYAKSSDQVKFNQLYKKRNALVEDELYKYVDTEEGGSRLVTAEERLRGGNVDPFCWDNPTSQGTASNHEPFEFEGKVYLPPKGRTWTSGSEGLRRLNYSHRLKSTTNSLRLKRYASDNPLKKYTDIWDDTGTGSFTDDKIYVVQTGTKVIARCILMSTDPGDLVLDPTCGSGTTAYVAEQWGRRWITIDTSRVSLALARARLMGAKYPYYLLADSKEGMLKECELSGRLSVNSSFTESLKLGFVYERVPKLSIKSIATNKEIDLIAERYKDSICSLLNNACSLTGKEVTEWNFRTILKSYEPKANKLLNELNSVLAQRKKEIDISNQRNVEFELLLDAPFIDKNKLRVCGPFTVESLSPHRILSTDPDGKMVDPLSQQEDNEAKDFASMIIENLRTNGIQSSEKSRKLDFVSIDEFPGEFVCAEGRYMEGEEGHQTERKAALMIGPEFGTLTRSDLVAAAREAAECGFDILIVAAFHFDGQSADITKLGRLPILKVMMNTDLMMGEALKGKGNLFVAFGEPDIAIEEIDANNIRIAVRGVDIFFPNTGEVRSDNQDGIACWFIDTDYDQESFFVRHAYFLGAKSPYESLKKSLKADINQEAWESIHSNVSRPFKKPDSGFVAVKIINHLGDEAMKVIRV